jgi:heterodisulfide reductase subunit A
MAMILQGATRKAKEDMRVGVARARHLQPYSKKRTAIQPLGTGDRRRLGRHDGGLAVADEGYDVFLVEKTYNLGGHLRNLYVNAESPNPQRLLTSLVKRVHSHERIALYYNTEVIGFEGHVGNFRTRLSYAGNGEPQRCWEVEHGVTIVAGSYEFKEECTSTASTRTWLHNWSWKNDCGRTLTPRANCAG